MKRTLHVKDIEKLENTSLAGALPYDGMQPASLPGDTNGCDICIGPTSCCNPDRTGQIEHICVGITACCGETMNCFLRPLQHAVE